MSAGLRLYTGSTAPMPMRVVRAAMAPMRLGASKPQVSGTHTSSPPAASNATASASESAGAAM